MDPASIGTTARIASSVVRPIIARLFVKESQGAGLVDKPVRVSRLVSWGGEKRSLTRLDMWKIARELVKVAVEANPHEPPVASDEREALADALAATLSALGDLDMDDVQAVRLGHVGLARRLTAARPDATRELSADATVLHDSLLDLSCLHILHFFTQRSTFVANAQVAQTRMLDETLRLLDALVDRIPRPGSADEEFETRYLAHIERKYGKLNIFGLDLSDPGRARWPLAAGHGVPQPGTGLAARRRLAVRQPPTCRGSPLRLQPGDAARPRGIRQDHPDAVAGRLRRAELLPRRAGEPARPRTVHGPAARARPGSRAATSRAVPRRDWQHPARITARALGRPGAEQRPRHGADRRRGRGLRERTSGRAALVARPR
jgi:hypothetical protein